MTRNHSDLVIDYPRELISDLLPWYVNKTLPAHEQALVEQHLSQSPTLREELADWEQIAAAIRSIKVTLLTPPPERLMTCVGSQAGQSTPSGQRKSRTV